MYQVLQCEVCREIYSIDFKRKYCFKIYCNGILHKVEGEAMIKACNVWVMTKIGPFIGYMPAKQVNEILAGVAFEQNTLAITTDDGTMYPILDILADTVLGEYTPHNDYSLPPEVSKQLIRRVYNESHQ